ncbi:hypothetical protein MASR2M48_09380 [Spirochaetota bacterium]
MSCSDNRERVLFLYLPTGGGHLSNAKAISRCISERYGAETLAYDPVSSRSPVGKAFLADGYRFLSLRLPLLWNMLFTFNGTRFLMALSQGSTRNFSRYGLRYIIDEWKPTRIVCLHHLLSPAIEDALVGREKVPVVVVCTDPFLPPKMWANGHSYHMICMSDEAYGFLLRQGVSKQNLQAFSIIIGEKFDTRMSPEGRASFMATMGLNPDKSLVLIAGGGDGMRGASKILAELCESSLDYQVAVVCGRDEATRRRAQKVADLAEARGRRSSSLALQTRCMN